MSTKRSPSPGEAGDAPDTVSDAPKAQQILSTRQRLGRLFNQFVSWSIGLAGVGGITTGAYFESHLSDALNYKHDETEAIAFKNQPPEEADKTWWERLGATTKKASELVWNKDLNGLKTLSLQKLQKLDWFKQGVELADDVVFWGVPVILEALVTLIALIKLLSILRHPTDPALLAMQRRLEDQAQELRDLRAGLQGRGASRAIATERAWRSLPRAIEVARTAARDLNLSSADAEGDDDPGLPLSLRRRQDPDGDADFTPPPGGGHRPRGKF